MSMIQDKHTNPEWKWLLRKYVDDGSHGLEDYYQTNDGPKIQLLPINYSANDGNRRVKSLVQIVVHRHNKSDAIVNNLKRFLIEIGFNFLQLVIQIKNRTILGISSLSFIRRSLKNVILFTTSQKMYIKLQLGIFSDTLVFFHTKKKRKRE
jgi:hypothetical protein